MIACKKKHIKFIEINDCYKLRSLVCLFRHVIDCFKNEKKLSQVQNIVESTFKFISKNISISESKNEKSLENYRHLCDFHLKYS